MTAAARQPRTMFRRFVGFSRVGAWRRRRVQRVFTRSLSLSVPSASTSVKPISRAESRSVIDEKRATIGSDWDVKVGDKTKVVARIDEKLMNVGGKYVITFLDKQLYKLAPFFKTIVLFTMMLRFKKDIMSTIGKLRSQIEQGKIKLDPAPEEEKFMWNPRLLRR